MDRNDPRVARLMNQQKRMILSMGQILGEEVRHVTRGIERPDTSVALAGGFSTIRCPGRERTDQGHAGSQRHVRGR